MSMLRFGQSEPRPGQESANQGRLVVTNQNTVQARSQPIRAENTFAVRQSATYRPGVRQSQYTMGSDSANYSSEQTKQ